MDEYVSAPSVDDDEAEALDVVEPLYGTGSHLLSPSRGRRVSLTTGGIWIGQPSRPWRLGPCR